MKLDLSIPTQPIIIIGMHRSGTSMVTRMLRELGLFVGWDVNDECEALFFLARNDRLLSVCSGSWDNPNAIDRIINNSRMRREVVRSLYCDLSSLPACSYLGPKLFIKYRSILNMDIRWGWKDPRNTFLLPLWLDIFPKARIIHMYRNGVDIAKSLSVREEDRIEGLFQSNSSFRQILARQKTQFENFRTLLYLARKIRNYYMRMSPLEKYERFRTHSCITLQEGFDLWNVYIERGFECVKVLANQSLSIKYEDFLLEPAQHLMEMKVFCDLPADEKQVERVAEKVNPTRRYAFKENQKLVEFYNTIKESYWIRRLGYDQKKIPN